MCLNVHAQVGTPRAPAPAPAPQAKTLPDLPNDKVVATLADGSSVTMGELRTLIGILDAQSQQASVADLQGVFQQHCPWPGSL